MQLTCNEQVVGSNPTRGSMSNFKNLLLMKKFMMFAVVALALTACCSKTTPAVEEVDSVKVDSVNIDSAVVDTID